jgi:hypothetical protein
LRLVRSFGTTRQFGLILLRGDDRSVALAKHGAPIDDVVPRRAA